MSDIQVRVARVVQESPRVRAYTLAAAPGTMLPAFTPGAHIDIRMGAVGSRSYSLMSSPEDLSSYVIGVALAENGSGGSQALFDRLSEGSEATISAPRNNFELDYGFTEYHLIAGGIGVTPLLCMARELSRRGLAWRLLYAVRSRGDVAFRAQLAELGDGVFIHVDDEQGRVLDLRHVVANAGSEAAFYCCGPSGMLSAFRDATAHVPARRARVEAFTKAQALQEGSDGFEVVLSRRNMRITVGAQETILNALQRSGVYVASACQEGVCGTCETRVLEGVPRHLDHILSERERAANATMMICCSRSLSPVLVLDV